MTDALLRPRRRQSSTRARRSAHSGLTQRRSATGELVFNTALSGYQEIVTDPSYAGQVITFTYPHIGNYGVNADDDESRRPFCAGVVVRDLAPHHSNWRATGSLDDLLVRHGVPGISGIDTRRLTRHLRDEGALPGRVRHRRGRGARRGRGRAQHRRHRPRRHRHHRRALRRRQRRRAVPRGRLRLRHQAHHPATPRRRRVVAWKSCRRRRPPPTSSRVSRMVCSSRTVRVIPPP